MSSYLKIKLLTFTIILLCSANLLAEPYRASFSTTISPNPQEINKFEFRPDILTKINFGPFMSWCDFPIYCVPPPEAFIIEVEWNSPNDTTCYWPVYMAGVLGPIEIFSRGHGSWGVKHWPPPWCCQWCGLRVGTNEYTFWIGPLISGKYKVSLFVLDWYLWRKQLEYCNESKPNYMWQRGRVIFQTSKKITIFNTNSDYTTNFSNLFFVNTETGDTIYDGNTLNVLTYYSVGCWARSTRRSEEMPENLSGWLYPEGIEDESHISFIRDRQGDNGPACDPEYPLRDYAYESQRSYRPLDLWNLLPEQWSSLSKTVQCSLRVSDNPDFMMDIGITEDVISDLYLKADNDTTFCFIPARGERADFKFIYDNSLGLQPDCQVLFQIKDKEGRLRHSVRVPIPDVTPDPDSFNLPDLPIPNRIQLHWDGRNTQGIYDLGHLADPDKSPYYAYVFIDEGGGMKSNIDTFSVVPMIDSLLLTHSPSYPPPGWYDTVAVYSVIRAKIDDSNISTNNYRYYIPAPESPETNPTELTFWVNERDTINYMFWDADEGVNQKFYYENNEVDTLPLTWWNNGLFGTLDYRWKVIHDKRSGDCSFDYSEVIDTTDWWGEKWWASITPPLNWSRPSDQPYMRILCFSEVSNTINGLILQADTSAIGKKAHKLIFGYNTFTPSLDIVDWAITHIGVPYGWCGPSGKIPYEQLDCASLVTATKIQEMMNNCEPPLLKIGPLVSINYYNGFSGNIRITRKIPLDSLWLDPQIRGNGARGCLIFIRKKDDQSPQWIDSRHIMIIYYMGFNRNSGLPDRCTVINERGGRTLNFGRARYDNAFTQWPPYHPDYFPEGEYIWTVLKWEL